MKEHKGMEMLNRFALAVFIVAGLIALTSGAFAAAIHHWSWDNVATDSIGTWDLTQGGNPVYGASCPFNQCTVLDGTDDEWYNVTKIELVTEGAPATLSFWAKSTGCTEAGTQDEGLLSFDSAAIHSITYFERCNDNTIEMRNADKDNLQCTFIKDLDQNVLYMFTVVDHSNTSLSIYVNGTHNETKTCATYDGWDMDLDAMFGDQFTGGRNFEGVLDEAWFFDTALSAVQISNLFTYNDIAGPGGAIWNYTVLSSTFTTPVIETSNTTFNFTIATNTSQIDNVTAIMSWNGTFYSPTSSGNTTNGDNNTYWFAYEDFAVPLTLTNNTNISEFWNYTIWWTNTTVRNYTDASNNQSIYHGFHWPEYTPDAISLELTPMNLTTNFTEYRSGIVDNVSVDFNGTTYYLTGSNGIYSLEITAPDVSGLNYTFTSNATMTVAFDGDFGPLRTFNRTSDNANTTVYEPGIVSCSVGGSVATLNFTFYTENNLTDLYSDMDATFTWYIYPDHSGHEYTGNFSASDTLNMTLCLYPNTILYVNSFQTYTDNGTDYRVRNYFLTNATISNTSSDISLYNIPTADSDLLTVTIKDNLVAQEGVYVLMERYYPGENLYRTVEIGLTDEDGQTFLYPVPNDVYYRFLIVQNYTTAYSGAPREIGTNSFIIDINEATGLEFFDFEDVAITCNKTGNIIGCSVVNPTGISIGAKLLVKQIGVYQDTEICSTEVSGVTSTTLLCNVSGYSGAIAADLLLLGSQYPGWTGTFQAATTNIYGTLGLVISIVLVVGSALLLGVSPVLTVIGAMLGVIVSALSGMWAVSLTSIVLILVAGGLIIVRLRS